MYFPFVGFSDWVGQIRVTLPVTSSIHAVSWVVICVAKYLNLQFPTSLINRTSAIPLNARDEWSSQLSTGRQPNA